MPSHDDDDRPAYDLARDATDEVSGGTAGGLGPVIAALSRALEPHALGLDRVRERLDEQGARLDALDERTEAAAVEVLATLRDVERHLAQVSTTITTAAGLLTSRPFLVAIAVLFVATSIGVASIVSAPPPILVSWLGASP